MHTTKTLLYLAALALPSLANIQVDFFTTNDCSDDSTKSTDIDPGSDQYTCIETLSDYKALKIVSDGDTSLLTCGPYYGDDTCHQALPNSDTHTCGDCSAFAGTSHLQVEQEL